MHVFVYNAVVSLPL